jgi:thymidylate kinase
MFITIEGVTGSGKSYFSDLLLKNLTEKYKLPVRKVGGFIDRPDNELPKITRFLKQLMKTARFLNLPWFCETLLLLSEQSYNVEEYVNPSIKGREIILYENYSDALWVYQLMQSEKSKVEKAKIESVLSLLIEMQYETFNYPKPDKIIFIKSNIFTIADRLNTRSGEPVPKNEIHEIEKVIVNYSHLYDGNSNVSLVNNEYDETNNDKNLIDIIERISIEINQDFIKIGHQTN